MIVVPIPPHKILVVLETTDVVHIGQHNNVQLTIRDYLRYCPLLREIHIGYASPQEIIQITEHVQQGREQAAVDLLCAGSLYEAKPGLNNDLVPKRFMP
jgi:hypothetical protein